jgi:hypothetical protein
LSPRFLPWEPLSPHILSSAPSSPHFCFFFTWVGHPSQWDHF